VRRPAGGAGGGAFLPGIRCQKKRKKALDKAPAAANNGWEWEMPAKMPVK